MNIYLLQAASQGGLHIIIVAFIVGVLLYLLIKIFKPAQKPAAGKARTPLPAQKDPGNNTRKRIFINYRREDSSGYSLALYNELLKRYNKDVLFKDFNSIEPGEDFEEAIDKGLNSCHILLVLIGERWLDILRQRQTHKNQPDFVALEISLALTKNIYIIPITINGAMMPDSEDMPQELKRLARRQCLNIEQTRFQTDVDKLVQIIDKKGITMP